MTLSFLLTSLIACGETGDTTDTTASDTAASDPTTAGGTDATASEPTGTGEPTSDTGSASETGDTTGVTTAETATGTTAVETTTEATTSETTTAETTGETSETTSETTGETTSETTGDPVGSPLVIAIVDAYLYADCMPVAEPDPVKGSWYVEFDNTDNPDDTAAVLTFASLSLENAEPPVVEPIMVQPIESPPLPAGEYISVEMAKLPGMAHSACEHCDEFYTLVLEYDENGVKHRAEESVTISCSF